MAGNDDLHGILSSIHRTLGDVLAKIQESVGELEKIREAIVEGVETLHEAIHDNIQAQAELQMMEHVADVQAITPQIDAEEDRVATEKSDLEDRLDQISNRYERRHEELDEKASSRVRDLGSHIFEIDEGEFESGIEEPFTDHVTATWSELRSANDSIEADRRDEIESSTGEVVQSIHRFVEQQEELLDRIDSSRSDLGFDVDEPTQVQLPYYTVTVEMDGREEVYEIVPSRIPSTSNRPGVDLEPMAGLEDIVASTELVDASTEPIQTSQVVKEGQRCLGEAPPLLSHASAIDDVLPQRFAISVEGGDR